MTTLIEAPTVWELVRRRAEATPDVRMLIDAADRTVTFGEFATKVERVAAGLLARGVEPGTPVTWQLPTRIESILIAIALARLGALQNPIIHLYREREVGAVLRASKPKFFVIPGQWRDRDYTAMAATIASDLATSPELIVVQDDGLPDGDPSTLPAPPDNGDDVRWIYYTSGTTSEPKGVRHTDQTLMAGGRGLALALDMSPDDIGSMAFPFSHIAGPDYLFMMIAAGFPAVLVEAFVPSDAVELFIKNGVTMIGGGTAFYSMFLAEQRKAPESKPFIPTLRKIAGGGAPKPPELYWAVQREIGVPLLHGYGMTEVPMICQGGPHDSDDQLAHTEGHPVAGIEVRIVTDSGKVAEAGEEGEVRVKGAIVCKGYTDDEATKAAFDDEGWFRTGDIGIKRDDGHVALTGRLKDVIIRKGENISAKELEDLLFAHPKVGDIAVIGLPDPERGERVCAVVEPPREGEHAGAVLDFAEMTAYLADAGIMTQKIPEQLEVVEALPRNETLNKVLKYKLREQFAD
jgi:acyl-CoA synthetase (AMP-forming)/AMP-acid ligase II